MSLDNSKVFGNIHEKTQELGSPVYAKASPSHPFDGWVAKLIYSIELLILVSKNTIKINRKLDI